MLPTYPSKGSKRLCKSEELGFTLIYPSPVDDLLQNLLAQTISRSYLLSADVANGLNPGFVDNEIYAEGLAPALNKGMVVSNDSGGDMTTEPWGFVLATRIAERTGQEVQRKLPSPPHEKSNSRC